MRSQRAGHNWATEQQQLMPHTNLRVSQFEFRRRQWHPTPVRLPGKSHGWRSLEGCSPWGRWELDTTQWLHVHFSLSCIGEGNGNPLQCSCLENPGDRGAWWAAISGVAQSWTWLKRLSSSSSMVNETSFTTCKLCYSEEQFIHFLSWSICTFLCLEIMMWGLFQVECFSVLHLFGNMDSWGD